MSGEMERDVNIVQFYKNLTNFLNFNELIF